MAESDRIYRTAVLPFAVLMIFGSFVLIAMIAFSGSPITYCPFIENEPTRRALIVAVAAVQLVLGVGLLLKSRIAWYCFFAYLGIGTIFQGLALTFDPPGQPSGLERVMFSLFALLVNGLIAVFLYSMRTVFRARQ